MNKPSAKYLIRLLVPALVLLFSGMLTAQTPLPPVEDISQEQQERRAADEHLSREARQLGREYLDVLRELHEIIADYSRYLADTDNEEITQQQRELKALMVHLSSGKYLRDLKTLPKDLASVKTELRQAEKQLRGEDREAYVITVNLRRSLQSLNNVLDSDLMSPNVEKAKMRTEIAECLEQAVKGNRVDVQKLQQVYMQMYSDRENFDVFIPDFDFDFAYRFEVDSLGDSKFVYSYTSPDTDSESVGVWVHTLPPRPPAPPRITVGNKSVVVTERSGDTRVVREFIDSIGFDSRKKQIVINNPSGDMRLEGWDKNQIMVRAEIGVSADKSDKAAKIADKIQLILQAENNRVVVGYELPSLNDPRVNIRNGTFFVMVPRSNPTSVTSSFGNVVATGLKNDVTMTLHHAPLKAESIAGDLSVTSNMGKVAISDVKGSISVTNRHAPIVVNGSQGLINISNEFERVTLGHNTGTVSIQNSGEVRVEHHTGDVTITNTNGAVWVVHSDGNFRLKNTFQPIHLEYLSGTIEAGNSHAPILASDIQGRFQATNVYAPIRASYFTGPIDFSSNNGQVFVDLNNELNGPSVIQATSSVINLRLEPGLNLLLRASTNGGDIQSTFPLDISSTGTTKSVELALGTAVHNLTVSGTKTKIIVIEEE